LDNKFNKSLHSIAPAGDTADTPVIQATGGPDALEDATGRKLLTYEDLIEAKRKCGWKGARLVLTNDHWNDLALDRKRFGDQLVNYKAGNPAPVIAGFELHKFEDGVHPLYTAAGAKKAFGAIKEAGDTEASVIFAKRAIAKKTGSTKQYFSKASENPTTQANLLNYRHYFVAVPYQAKKIGAIR
jgi:hypothetical protein